MHYKNGREAKEGDPVIFVNDYPVKRVESGKIHSILPGSITCNCQVIQAVLGGTSNTCKTIGEMYHAEDAFMALESSTFAPKEISG